MSFFGKFKTAATYGTQTGHGAAPAKKDPNISQQTPLERHVADTAGPVRPDGSDKFYGFENYGSTCYCNSIIQCLYYSAPFRSNVINFPSQTYLDTVTPAGGDDGAPLPPRSTSQIPYPNATSPARKEAAAPTSSGAQSGGKPEESKDSPEYRKRMALKAGPVLSMIHDHSNRYGMDETLFTALKDIFDAIKNNKSRLGVVSPHKFLEILRRENEMFRSAMHQDAHEFLNLLLNQVVDDVELFAKQHPSLMNGGDPDGSTLEKALANVGAGAPLLSSSSTIAANGMDAHWVRDLFEGLLTSETRCLTCENTSQRDEPFLDLSVDLSAHSSVTSCLRKFSEEEMLCERNKFHCDNCGGLQEAEKRMKIKRLPRVLALHLKRFKYTEDLQRLQKLFHRVVYPFHLRLFNTTDDAEDPDRLYELYAVVVHIGGGPYHGHYVSIIKTQDRGWLLFDDELVEPVDKEYVLNFFGGEPVPGLQDAKQLACAYVLFYQETTLEAVLHEQEMERQQKAAAVSRVSDAERLDTNFTQAPNGHHHAFSPTTPSVDGTEQMSALAHVSTAHSVVSPEESQPAGPFPAPPVPPLPTGAANLERSKTKKELKVEEKERKAAAKAEAKAEEDRRRQASLKRVEAWKKSTDEMHAAIEASKLSAAKEATDRGDEPMPAGPTLKERDSTGGFGRFKHGSVSLRGKPRWMLGGSGRDKDKDKDKDGPATKVLGAQNGQDVARDTHSNLKAEERDVVPDAVPSTPIGAEEKTPSKRNRFSIGRKRSQLID